MKTIAFFGSALPAPDDPVYQATREIGRLLGQAGYAVMTGGADGLMAAASQGAHDAGARAVGVICMQVERHLGSKPNQWLTDVIERDSLRDRLTALVELPDAYVVMPGGLGTLTELTFLSDSMRSGDIPRKPMICYGEFWRPLVQMTAESGYMHHNAWGSLHFADTPEQVLELITTHVPF